MMRAKDWHRYYLFKVVFVDGEFIMQTPDTTIDDIKCDKQISHIRLVPQQPALPDFRIPIPPNTVPLCFRRIRMSTNGELVDMKFMIGYKDKKGIKRLKYVSIFDRKVIDLVE